MARERDPFYSCPTGSLGKPRSWPTPELRIPNAAAQTRVVSKARIWLDSRKSVRPFKGIICNDVSEFESYMPSQISVFADFVVALAAVCIAIAVVSANRSNGWRKLATTWPSSKVQFESRKFSRRRFSRGSCCSNSFWAFRASSRS